MSDPGTPSDPSPPSDLVEVSFNDGKSFKFTPLQAQQLPFLMSCKKFVEGTTQKVEIHQSSLGFKYLHAWATLPESELSCPPGKESAMQAQAKFFGLEMEEDTSAPRRYLWEEVARWKYIRRRVETHPPPPLYKYQYGLITPLTDPDQSPEERDLQRQKIWDYLYEQGILDDNCYCTGATFDERRWRCLPNPALNPLRDNLETAYLDLERKCMAGTLPQGVHITSGHLVTKEDQYASLPHEKHQIVTLYRRVEA